MPRHCVMAIVAAVVLCCGIPAATRAGQIGLPVQESSLYLESSRDAEKLLDAAHQAVRARAWRKAVGLFQTAAEFTAKPRGPGDLPPQPLLPSPGDPSVLLPVQDVAALELARLPEPALELYRQGYSAAARELLGGALADKDPARLALVGRRYLATEQGADALAALGAVAFERGDCVGAIAAWERLLEAHPGRGGRLPSVRARMWACYEALGRTEDAKRVADGLLATHANAEIDLGGRSVRIADFLKQPVSLAAAAPLEEWPLLGGDASHARLPRGIEEVGESVWTLPLEGAAVTDAGRREFERRGLPIPHVLHPTVADGRLVVADDATVYARDAATGRPIWMYPDGPVPSSGLRLAEALHAPACADGRVFVSLEAGVAAFDAPTGRLLWRHVFERRTLQHKKDAKEKKEGEAKAEDDEDSAELGSKELVFTTAPVVADGLVVVGHTALGEEARASLVALDARDGQVAWRTFLCSRTLTAFLAMGAAGSPPAVAGTTVYTSTNLGALAAVDLPTGRIRWVRPYREFRGRLRQSIIERTHRWASNPVLVHRGLALAAPQDCPSLLAVDAADGSLAWRVPRSGGRYLVGVEGSRAFVVGRQAVALDLRTAKRLWATDVPGTLAGRPLLCQGRLLIPTADRLLGAATADGSLSVERIWSGGERPGNLMAAAGRLFVASCDRVHAYGDWAERRKQLDARRDAEPAAVSLALGTHALRRGRYQEAEALLKQALSLAAAKQPPQDDVTRAARQALYAAYRGIGNQAALRLAVAHAPTPADAADTQRQLARLHERGERWAEAVAAWQAIVEGYPTARLETEGGLSVRGRALASAEIARLVRDRGRAVYATQETRAREALIAAQTAQELEAVARRFPNSEGAEQALVKRLAMPDARQMAPELAALAHSLASEPASPARALITQSLERWRKQTLAANPPLRRRWQVYTRVAHRRVEHFSLPGLPRDLLYFATAQRSFSHALPLDGLECRLPETGQLVWQRDLSEWNRVGVAAGGHLVLATSDRLVALDASSGAFRWGYSLTEDGPLTAADLTPSPLRGRRRAEGRRIVALAASEDGVFAAASGGKVFALAAADGQRRWVRELGRVDDAVFLLSRGLYPQGDRLWVVAEHPASVYALEQRDGSGGPTIALAGPERRVTDLPAYDEANGRLYLILGDRAVQAVDLRAGKALWRTTTEFGISRVLVAHEGKHCYVLPDSFAQNVAILSLDPATGKIVRRRSLHLGGLADAAAASDVLYLAEKDTDNDLVIHALDPDDLGERWRTLPLRLFHPSDLAVSEDFVAVTGRHAGQAVGVLVNAANGKIAGDVKPPGVTQVSAVLVGDLFCLGADRGIHAYGPVDGDDLDARIAILGARHDAGDPSALGPLASALYQRGDAAPAVQLLAKALTQEGLTDERYATLKDQLNSLREALVAERPPQIVARRFETAPNIDGVIDEPWRRDRAAVLDSPAHIEEVQGRSVRESRWTSPSDLSAVLYTGWDPKHFYFAIDVSDDIHRTYTGERDTWVGDGLIISIDCDNDGGYGYSFTGRDLLLTLALTRKDERKDDQDQDDTPKGAYRVRRKDDNSGTVYECAIPWAYMKMAPPRPGQRLGFNITVTDDDGDRATKAVSWTPGMLLDRDRDLMIRGFTPAWFGDVLLEDAGAPPPLVKPPAVLQPEDTDR